MSRRAGGSGIRGPNSALTDFLRERGISAADIARRARERAALAATETEAEGASASEAGATPGPATSSAPATGANTPDHTASSTPALDSSNSTPAAESSAAGAAHGRRSTTAVKKRKKRNADDDGEEEWNMYSAPLPNPGQISHCAECGDRFTVTTYSKAGPNGDGLLCAKCGKKVAAKDKEKPAPKKRAAKRTKRDLTRTLLDGAQTGAGTLKSYCIKLVAKFIDHVDELGDISTHDMDQICQIISRNRSLNSSTLKLFLTPQTTRLRLYDCAKVTEQDLLDIPRLIPGLKHLDLTHAGFMTDSVLSYYAEKLPDLTSLHIRGAFLVSRDALISFFQQVGSRLTSFTISSTARTSETVIEALVKNCPKLEHLTLSNLQRFDNAHLTHLSNLRQLTSLDISHAGGEITDEALVPVIQSIGGGLRSLNLAGNYLLSSNTTEAIASHCPILRELNLEQLEELEDKDIISLFSTWAQNGNSGLVDLNLSRVVQLTDEGLGAVVAHSKGSLERLGVNSCEKLTAGGLKMLAGECAKLRELDAGFVRAVEDEAVELLASVGVKRVGVWGCGRVTETVNTRLGDGENMIVVGREGVVA